MNVEMSGYEKKTREMIETFRAHRDEKLTSAEIAVTIVFRAMWSASLPLDRIQQIANALTGGEVSEIAAALRVMVREKFLRSEVRSGVRIYEVNF